MAILIAGLNLVFYRDIWSGSANQSAAAMAVAGLVVAQGLQFLWMLLRWPEPAGAPWWWRKLFWLGTRAAAWLVIICGTFITLILLGALVLFGS